MTTIDKINSLVRQMEKDADFLGSVGNGLGWLSRKAWGGLGVAASNAKYIGDAVGNAPRMWGGKNWWGDDFQDSSWLDYNRAGWRAGQDSAETGAVGLAQGMASAVGINSDTLDNAADVSMDQMKDKGYDQDAIDFFHSGANLAGQIAGEGAVMKGVGAASKPLAASGNKFVRTVGKALPYAPLAVPAAKGVVGGVADLADAAATRIAKKKQQAEEWKKWLQYGGAGLGGILTFMLANSMLNSNSGSSGSDKKREESVWERLLKSVLATGVGAAGAYGGYKLGRTAYDYLYNQHKYEVLMNQIKQTGGEAWNKVKSWFS